MFWKRLAIFGQSILCSYFAIMGALTRSNVMLCTALFIMLICLPLTFLYIVIKEDGED